MATVVLVLGSGVANAEPKLWLSELQQVDANPPPLPRPAFNVAVASDGTQWLAVYGGADALAANWVGSDGAPLMNGFAVGPSGYATRPRVVFDGTRYLVAWQTYGGAEKNVGAQWVDQNGAGPILDLGLPLDEDGLSFDLTVDGEATPRAIACGADQDSSSCVTAALGAGDQVTHESFELPFRVLDVRLAYSGTNGMALVETVEHAVVWATLDKDGALGQWSMLEPASATGDGAAPSIIAQGGGFVATWHRKDGIALARLSTAGAVTAQQLVTGNGSFTRPTLLETAEQLLLFSSAPSATCGYCTDAYVQSLGVALDTAASAPTLLAEARISGPVAALAGAQAAVISSGTERVDAVLIDPKQLAAKPEAKSIAFRAPLASSPVLATAPAGWLLAWSEQDTLKSALVDPNGAISPFAIDLPGSRQVPLALTEGGDGWLMVWSGDGARVSRLDATGKAAATSYALDFPQVVRVARSSSGWLVAWSHWAGQTSTLTADFFTFDGKHQKTLTVAEGVTGTNPVSFDLAGTADGFQVVWSAAYGVGSLDLDANAMALRSPQVITDVTTLDSLSFAKAGENAWLGYTAASKAYFSALPVAPVAVTDMLVKSWSPLQPFGDSVLLAWTRDDDTATTGRISQGSVAGALLASDITFPTSLTHGFALSETKGDRALLATCATLEPFGFPASRLEVGVISFGEPPVVGGVAGEGAGGGSDQPMMGDAGQPSAAGGSSSTGGTDAVAGTGEEALAGAPTAAGGAAGGEGTAGSGNPAAKSGDGCDCRIAGRAPTSKLGILPLLLGAAWLVRRRRTRYKHRD